MDVRFAGWVVRCSLWVNWGLRISGVEELGGWAVSVVGERSMRWRLLSWVVRMCCTALHSIIKPNHAGVSLLFCLEVQMSGRVGM